MAKGKKKQLKTIQATICPLLLKEIIEKEVWQSQNFLAFRRTHDIQEIIDRHRVFSNKKVLYKFQEEALKYAIDSILAYYHWFHNFNQNFYFYNIDETDTTLSGTTYGEQMKNTLYQHYNHRIRSHTSQCAKTFPPKYSEVEEEVMKLFYPNNYIGKTEIPFKDIVNMTSMWMATGSGKTLVIASLIDILFELMEKGLIPTKPVLFLTAREDLLRHFQKHVQEQGRLHVKNLREVRRYSNTLIKDRIVYVYPAYLITKEEKNNEIDFRNYELGGKWYIILDEAHKGDGDSVIKHRIAAMARNGYLFNFSATFTGEIEQLTTAYEFNLHSFIEQGYGKNIVLFKESVNLPKNGTVRRSSRDAILASLLLLAAEREIAFNKNKKYLYHMHAPLGVYIVRTVEGNNKKYKKELKQAMSDMQALLTVLIDVASGTNVSDQDLINAAKKITNSDKFSPEFYSDKQLNADFYAQQIADVIYEQQNQINPNRLRALLYKNIFGTDGPTNIRFTAIEKSDEVVLKNGNEEKFALIRVAATKDIKNFLIQQFGLKESDSISNKIFDHLDEEDNRNISILLGSRKFYEGWDSSRPNVITFIGLGTNENNSKFVLQAIGRGVRVKWDDRYGQHVIHGNFIGQEQHLLETLFVFATDNEIMDKILQGIATEKRAALIERISSIKKNPQIKTNSPVSLIVPKIIKKIDTISSNANIAIRVPQGYEKIIKSATDGKLFHLLAPVLVQYDITEEAIKELLNYVRKHVMPDNSIDSNRFIREFHKSTRFLLTYSLLYSNTIKAIKFRKLKDDDIIHFQHMELVGKDKNIRTNIFNQVKQALQSAIQQQQQQSLSSSNYDISVKILSTHFYIPVITSDLQKDIYVRHAINEQSERTFIEDLITNINLLSQKFGDKWVISKLDESIDKIHFPYQDVDGELREYYPDFIMWTQIDDTIIITLIDPKSIAYSSPLNKIKGICTIFEDANTQKPKTFTYNNLKVGVIALVYNQQPLPPNDPYAPYTVNSITDLVNRIEQAHKAL